MLALEAQLRRVSALAAACQEAMCYASSNLDVTVENSAARGRGCAHDPVPPGPPDHRMAGLPHAAAFASSPSVHAIAPGSRRVDQRDILSALKRYQCARARAYHTTSSATHAAASGQASSVPDNIIHTSSTPAPATAEAVLPPALEARVRQLHARCAELVEQLSSGADQAPSALREAGREYSRLQPLAAAYDRLTAVRKELSELQSLLRDPDPGVRALAAEEEAGLSEQASSLTRQLLLSLLPPDPRASRPALLEVRAGAGGEEATLFAAELLAMYERYAQLQGWSWQLLELGATDLGGVRHAVAAVGAEHGQQGGGAGAGTGGGQDQGPYGMLRPEAGVHRVQRVPVTDAGGRVHTSTAAVVVLPQADEVDVVIRDEDLRVETMRASGAGGQHVNVTDSAVRLTHLPTGTVVACQNERSQHRNLAAAMKVLRSRLYDMEMHKRSREVDSVRQAAVGTAERNERIRTYNYQQNRVTDHRVGVTVHDLAGVLAGEALDRLLGPLRAAAEEEALRALMEQEGEGA